MSAGGLLSSIVNLLIHTEGEVINTVRSINPAEGFRFVM